MRVTDAQVKRLRAEMTKSSRVGVAAARAGMSRNSATKYLKTDKLPSELKAPRTWRTREDPFEKDWAQIEAMLKEAPGLEAKTLFEELQSKHPERYCTGQLRTLQRHVKQWRAEHGPDKDLFFPQEHRAGEAMQTDFTSMNALEITIAGEPYEHKLCHCALPYSDWSWGTPCRSESIAAIKMGVQAAVFRLGCVPEFHQTDNSTAATHRLESGKREFNEDYLDVMKHLEMKPRTTKIGKKEQNGDIEAANGALKRFINQRLLLRGSRDFKSHDEYQAWLHGVLEARNQARSVRLHQEIKVMRALRVAPLPEYTEIKVRVSGGGTIRVKTNTYSVPARLKDEWVRVRVYDDRLEICYADKLQLCVERLVGKQRHRINYRHVVHSMLRKPGAFRRYRFRDDLFPTETFREAFEVLDARLLERKADLEYLRILELAATTMESEVEKVLMHLLSIDALPTAREIQEKVAPEPIEIPDLAAPIIDLDSYDGLLDHAVEVSA